MEKQHTIILTGATGLLGRAFLDLVPEYVKVIPTSFSNKTLRKYKQFSFLEVNITNKQALADVFAFVQPTIVVHAASIGNVDYCEEHKDEATMVNVEGTRNIIEAAQKYEAKIIFASSNAVFDGTGAPYSESSKTNPVNYYGETKVIGEELVQGCNLPFVIARLILMYGWNHPSGRQNPVTWLIEKLIKSEPIKLVNDTYTNPLLNWQASQALWKTIELGETGIFNIAGGESANRYEFGIKTAEVFSLNSKLIEPVSSDYFPGIAARMPNTTYDTTVMEEVLGLRPFTLEEGLTYMKNHQSEVNCESPPLPL